MGDDFGEAVAEDTDQGSDEENVGHADENEHERRTEGWVDVAHDVLALLLKLYTTTEH